MRKIHFISLFCVDFDHDIMVQWAAHIKSYGFDSYTVVLNSPYNNNRLLTKCSTYFLLEGFSVDIDKRPFNNMELRVGVMRDFQNKRLTDNADDYMCVCDSDELPLFPKNIAGIIRGRDGSQTRLNPVFVKGKMVDRFADTLKAGSADGDLFEQFPIEGNLEHIIKNGRDGSQTRLDDSQYFFEMPREKFLIFPLNCEMDFTGCHVVYKNEEKNNPSDSNTWPTKINIMHFTWRDGIIERMCMKQFNHPSKILAVTQFFKIEPPQCLSDRIDADARIRGMYV
jgi:hypothetical protein